MAQSLACLPIHIVFSTKNREPTISDACVKRLYEYIGGLTYHRKCRLIEAGGMPDHIHLLVSLARDISVSEFVRDIKANSSRWVHEVILEPDFVWQNGYGAFAVSQSVVPTVIEYIQKQHEHHVTRTFQDEYRALLTKHGIEFDERYVWD